MTVEALKNLMIVLLEEASFNKDYISSCTVGWFLQQKSIQEGSGGKKKTPYAHHNKC